MLTAPLVAQLFRRKCLMRRVNVAVRRSAPPVTVNDDEVKKQRREDSHFYLWVTIAFNEEIRENDSQLSFGCPTTLA
jgi:hypothetical protein